MSPSIPGGSLFQLRLDMNDQQPRHKRNSVQFCGINSEKTELLYRFNPLNYSVEIFVYLRRNA